MNTELPVKQIKLTNGEEILCQTTDEELNKEEGNIVITGAMTISIFEPDYEEMQEGMYRYVFHNFMSIQDDIRKEINIKARNVIGWYDPSESVVVNYYDIYEASIPKIGGDSDETSENIGKNVVHLHRKN